MKNKKSNELLLNEYNIKMKYISFQMYIKIIYKFFGFRKA